MMTDEEWASSLDGVELAKTLRNRSDRKRLLFAVACARRVLQVAGDPECVKTLDLAESYADDGIPHELSRATAEAYHRVDHEHSNDRRRTARQAEYTALDQNAPVAT